jgi:hypothetical protein
MRGFCWSSASIVVSWVAMATAQQTAPVLRYTPPTNTLRTGTEAVEDYSFTDCNASLQIYPFRPFSGDIRQIFQSTLLRDWIDPMHQEENVAGPPTFQPVAIPGAELTLAASFVENIVGLPRPHLRMVIVAGGRAAVVDASAGTAQCWEQAIPRLNAMAATLRVEEKREPLPLSPASGRSVAGLYMGFKSKYTTTMSNVTGSSTFEPAVHYYLFSADGRVYCAYDKLEVPGGDVGRFDFDAAERRDPDNSGRYTVDGGKLYIKMGRDHLETMIVPLPTNGSLTINTVVYTRQ